MEIAKPIKISLQLEKQEEPAPSFLDHLKEIGKQFGEGRFLFSSHFERRARNMEKEPQTAQEIVDSPIQAPQEQEYTIGDVIGLNFSLSDITDTEFLI